MGLWAQLRRYGGYGSSLLCEVLEPVELGWVVPLLGDVAVATGTGIGGSGANARSELVANAALTILARRADEGVVAQLARVQAEVCKRTILAGVAKALDVAAARAGLLPEQLFERTVPTFGLGPDGVSAQPAGEHTALLVLDAGGTPALRFRNPAGRVVTSIPKVARERQADLLADLRLAGQAVRLASGARSPVMSRPGEWPGGCRPGRAPGRRRPA